MINDPNKWKLNVSMDPPKRSILEQLLIGNDWVPPVLTSTADTDPLLTEAKAKMQAAQEAERAAAQVKNPEPGRMTDTQLGIAALLTLLAGDRNADFSNALAGSMQQSAIQKAQKAEADVELQRAGKQIEAQQAYKWAEFLMSQRRDALNEAARREERADTKSYQDRRLNMDQAQFEAKEQADKEANLRANYRLATTPNAMRTAGQALRNAEWIKDAPTAAEVEADIERRMAPDRFRASSDFRADVNQRLNAFGEIDDAQAAELEKRRSYLIATIFDGNDNALPKIPTGKTIKAQALDQRKKEFGERLTFIKAEHRDNLAIKKGNLDVARQRLTYAARNAATGELNAQTRRLEYELKEYNSLAKSLNSDIDKAITGKGGIDQRIAGLRAEQKALKARQNMAKAGEVEAQIQKLAAERDYLIGLKESAVSEQAEQAQGRTGTVVVGGKEVRYRINP